MLSNYIQVASQLEFSRLVCALERIPRISFLHMYNGKKVLSVQMDVLKEKPILYYVPITKTGQYICYGFNYDVEEASLVNGIKNTTKLYSPIIHIKSLPNSLLTNIDDKINYIPMELEDLSSLAKLSYLFEESPSPLFLFPYKNNWLLGMFVTFNDNETSYFCYIMLTKNPNKPYLRYSTNNDEQPTFVDNILRHGYSYMKIIKLNDMHPLIKL